jgi:hypothetical protein
VCLAVEPCFLVQGRLSASPPRFEPRPWLPGCCAERARRGRACTCTVAATHRRALTWDARLAWVLGGTAAARSAWTFHVLVLAVAVRLPRRPVGVVRVGAVVVDATAVTPRAASLVTRELHRVGVRGECTPACWQATHPSVEPPPSLVRRADVQGAHAQRVGLGPDEVFWTPWATRGSRSCRLGNHNHRR